MAIEAPLSRAVGWIDSRLAKFEIHSPQALLASLKAVAELAHAADYLLRSEDPRWRAVGGRWLERAWEAIRGGTLVREVIAADPRFVLTSIVFLPFYLCGRRHAGMHAAVAEQIKSVSMGRLEWTLMVPTLDIYGIPYSAAATHEARVISPLANRQEPATMPRDAAYLFAHECLYATRWGHEAPIFDPETAAYVGRALHELVDRFSQVGDADVLAEIILAIHATERGCVDPAIWKILTAAQGEAGNLETPEFMSMVPRAEHPHMTRTYHSTLVAIMAWASCGHGPVLG